MIDFQGHLYNSANVAGTNNGGDVFFDGGDPITGIAWENNISTDWNLYSSPLIAPLFTSGSSGTVDGGPTTTYGETTFNGHAAFCVDWTGDYNVNACISTAKSDTSVTNSTQMLIVNRDDIGRGDFDIVFNYGRVQWDHQSTSANNEDEDTNPCGEAAVAGWKTASGAGTQLPGAFTYGAYLDGGPNALVSGSLGSSTPGQYIWPIRNGRGHPVVPPAQTLGDCGGGDPQSADGFAVNPAGCEADPVNTATGNYYTHVTDLSLAGIGVPFRFTRSYNSADATPSTMGLGWTNNLNAALHVQSNGDALVRASDGQQALFALKTDGSYSPPLGGRSTLTAVSGGGWMLVTHDQMREGFNELGQLTSRKDRNGQGLSLSYNADGTLATVLDSVGRTITFSYNAAGQLAQVAVPDGRRAAYAYDPNGYLITVTDTRDGTTTYSYDASGRLDKVVDQNNNTVVQNTYDATTGRVIAQLNGVGKSSTFAWDQASQTSTFTDARGNTTKDVYSNNALIARVDGLGNRTDYIYDADLNLEKVVDANGNATSMTYDTDGNMLTRTAPSPLSYEETWTYGALNNPLTYTNRRRKTTDYGYDDVGNLTSITQPDPDGSGPLARPVTQFGLDAAGTGLVSSITDPRDKTTRFGYDSRGNVTSMTSPLGAKTTMGYDASGRMTSVVNPRGNVTGADPSQHTTTFGYDNADHRRTITDPLGQITTTPYDLGGRLRSITDANEHSTTYGYDSANRLQTVTAPDQTQTTSGYDEVGNLTSRTDANNHETTYTYDAADRLKTVTSPSGRTWTYRRDGKGDLLDILYPDNTKIFYRHDKVGRLTSLYANSVLNFAFDYDENGNRKAVRCVNDYPTCNLGRHTYSYDALDRLSTVDSLSYAYDAAGNLIRRTTNPSGGLTTAIQTGYAYDDDGRLQSVAGPTGTATLGYDAASNLTTTTLPSGNGYAETRSYDRAGRLSAVKTAKGSTVLADVDVTRDPVGNPLTTVQTGATSSTTTHTYDLLDRVTGVCYQASPCTASTSPFIRWTYDAVGNRKTEARPGATTTSTYNVDDQLLSAGATTYAYDPNGNQTTAGTTTNTYDGLRRLASTTTGKKTTNFVYDPDGLRVQASTGTQAANTTNYVWDPVGSVPQVALESDGSQSPLRSYVYGGNRLSMSTYGTGAGTFYYHHDPLGSVINLTSSTGATQWTNAYEPFGSLRTQTKNANKAPANSMLFTGESLDSTGLYNLRARQYDPTNGRFISPDPVPPSQRAPFFSAYQYAQDRPTVYTDPTGLFCIDPTGITCGVQNTVTGFVGDNADAFAGLAAAGVCTASAGLGCAVAIGTAFIVSMISPVQRLVKGDACGFGRELVVNGVLAVGGLGILSILKQMNNIDLKNIPMPVSAWLSGPGAMYSGADLLTQFNLQFDCATEPTGDNGK